MPDIPGYRIVREIGRGGMATVFLAIQEKFDRQVAVKVMDSELLHDETFSKRFRREAQIVAKLNHPHIIQVYDVGLAVNRHYLVMELVTGGELNDRLEQGLDVGTAFRVTKEIARALDFAHAQNFIHRDIKPENILFREDGSSVLSDFGIARGMDNETQITTMGSVVGTPYYMSPEQVTGERLDGRSDLYSLGVVFYKTLTGKVPYDGDSALNIGIRHIKDPLPKLPSGLAKMQPLIDRFMAKMPAHRYQSGAEVVEALEAYEKQSAMPSSVARTEIIDSSIVDEIKRQTGQGDANPAPGGQRPSVTRVMRVKPKRRSPLRFVVIGVGLALVIAGAAWFAVQQRGEGIEATSESPLSGSEAPDAGIDAASLANLVSAADAERARGQLIGDGSHNALALYRSVLAQAPGHRGALAGIDAIGRSLAERGLEAVKAGDLEAARGALAHAQPLAPGAQVVVRLAARIHELDGARGLLAQAQARLDAGNLTQPAEDSAVTLVMRLLDLPNPPAGTEALRAALVERLEAVAADAIAYDMTREAAPYTAAARALSSG